MSEDIPDAAVYCQAVLDLIFRFVSIRDEQSGPGGTDTGTGTKIFYEQDQDQNIFFGPRP